MTRFVTLLAALSCLVSSLWAENVRIDARTDALLLSTANAKMVGNLTPNEPYTITVTGSVTAPVQGVFFMLSTPTEHQFRFAPFDSAFTFVPINGPYQLAAFYVDWSTTADNSGTATVSIDGPTSQTLTIDARQDAILLDNVTPIVGTLQGGLPYVVSVHDSAISGTPMRGAFIVGQSATGEFDCRFVPDGEGFVFQPIANTYQLAAFYVDWADVSDNVGIVKVDIKPRGPITRTIHLDEHNDALLLTSQNAKVVNDLTPNKTYKVSVSSTATAPMQGAFFMLQTPTEHNFRYVKPGQSFTFVPVDGLVQLAAFYVDWSDLSDNSGQVTVDITGPTNQTLTLDAKSDAIQLDLVTPLHTGMDPGPGGHEWIYSVRDSSVAGTPVKGAYFMYLVEPDSFEFRYIPPSGAIVFRPIPGIYQIAPLIVDWSTKDDNSGAVIVDASGPVLVPVKERLQPLAYSLAQNFPNPFNPSTKIQYSLPQRSHVNLSIFTSLGTKVAELVNEEVSAGAHEVTFRADNLATGVYFYRLQARDYVQTRSLLLIK